MLKAIILKRLREPSTYAGFGLILGALGTTLSDGQIGAIVTAISGIGGLLAVFLGEKGE